MERAARHSWSAAMGLQLLCVIVAVVIVTGPDSAQGNVFTSAAYRRTQKVCVDLLGINPFRLAQYDKFVYPPDQSTMCLIRCVGIVLRFWDDKEGFNVTFVEQEFRPVIDAKFKQTLTEAIATKLELIDPLDVCSRAYYAFRTFRNLLRQLLNPTSPKPGSCQVFQPLTAVQIVNAIADCVRESGNLSTALLFNFTKGIITDVEPMRCLIFCAAKRTGVYSASEGPLLENLHRQLSPPGEDLRSFVLRQKLCLQRNEQPAGTDECSRAFNQFFACTRPDYEKFIIKNLDDALVAALQRLLAANSTAGTSTRPAISDTAPSSSNDPSARFNQLFNDGYM
ncbi:uncharacterized protein LOC118458792 [Anopheles albimanus]|uniref:Uncharacterized protein n=1 Tax=Anopheles albimanus TaxID=7167 RepID=A0A8W7K8Y0_ANOAL|nr:uncharacterized protein LOC118458792 [Anopheles albimanus]